MHHRAVLVDREVDGTTRPSLVEPRAAEVVDEMDGHVAPRLRHAPRARDLDRKLLELHAHLLEDRRDVRATAARDGEEQSRHRPGPRLVVPIDTYDVPADGPCVEPHATLPHEESVLYLALLDRAFQRPATLAIHLTLLLSRSATR